MANTSSKPADKPADTTSTTGKKTAVKAGDPADRDVWVSLDGKVTRGAAPEGGSVRVATKGDVLTAYAADLLNG